MDLRPLLLIAVLFLSGCLEGAPVTDAKDADAADPDGVGDLTPKRTETYLLLDPLLGPNGMSNSFSIDLDEDDTLLGLQGDWRCVSMCPLAYSIVAPDGAVAAQGDSMGSTWDEVVDVTAPGTWTVVYTADGDAAIGIQGEASLTVY